jgi:hypothetical protein
VTSTVAPVTTGRARAAWPGLALALGQLSLMATSLLLSLALGYAGGLTAVGAVAPAMLVFQLTCGVLQRSLAEATLLSAANAGEPVDRLTCGRAVSTALVGGVVGGVAALLSTVTVSAGSPWLAPCYVAGIPFAIVLDIGRAAAVAAGRARSAFVESALWLAAQTLSALLFAALRSPVGICVSWALVNTVCCLLASAQPCRRPVVRGLGGWLRTRREAVSAASLDAFVVGVTPVLALQVTTFVAGAATLGVIRVLQQLLAPLAFLSIIFRRVLIFRRPAGVETTVRRDLRDGVVALALMAAGAAVLGAAVLVGRRVVPALSFIPAGGALVAAGLEKIALGFSHGCSLSGFLRGDFGTLLRARYVMLALSVLTAPLLTIPWGASGYLVGSALGMVAYSAVVLFLARSRRGSSPRGQS